MCGSMPAHLEQVISVIAFRGQNRSEAQYVVSNSVGRTDGTGIVQQVGAGPGRRSITACRGLDVAFLWHWNCAVAALGCRSGLWLRCATLRNPSCGLMVQSTLHCS